MIPQTTAYPRGDGKISALILIGLFLAVFVAGPGCEAQQKEVEDEKTRVSDVRAATTQAIADLTKQLEALPADDPARVLAERQIVKLTDALRKLDAWLVQADKLTTAVKDPSDPASQAVIQTLPYGNYVLLALFAASAVGNFVQRSKLLESGKAIRQLVSGVEAAIPEKTEAQKLKLAAAQDESTKKLVSEIKGG